MTTFNNKKEREDALKDMKAGETAREEPTIQDRFEFAHHSQICNAQHEKFNSAQFL